MEVLPRRGDRAGAASRGGAMNGDSSARCYGILVRDSTNGGQRRDEELTETHTRVVVASEEVSEARFVVGGG